MNNKEAKAIIANYKPHRGFFNLSDKPEGLNDIEYANILKLQNFIAEQNEQREYMRKFNPTQWEKLSEISAKLQRIILCHWGDSAFQ